MKPTRSTPPSTFATSCRGCPASLVLATGAGANARKSIGITVFSRMIASTCLAMLFVPAFFVVIQRFENWLKERRGKTAAPQTIPQLPSATP